jgi:hypothetical protein
MSRKNTKIKTKTKPLPSKQVDGKEYAKARTIDEVLGVHRYSQYEILEEAAYEESLDKLMVIDLQRECVRVGLLPHDNPVLMKSRLMKVFRDYKAAIETADLQPTIVEPTVTAENIMKRLSFGS